MFIMTHPYSGGEDNKDSVEDNQDGQKAQKKEPEPEKYVNLLIHCRKFKLLVYNFNYLSENEFFFNHETDLNLNGQKYERWHT